MIQFTLHSNLLMLLLNCSLSFNIIHNRYTDVLLDKLTSNLGRLNAQGDGFMSTYHL